ncbi:MAG: hypothetical protein JNN08_07215 [Bryobacterales bacterium]|nr:hypothetical protein [Bryobacterales bacterium]
MIRAFWLLLFSWALWAAPPQAPVDRILERLDRLERENDSLRRELHELRTQVVNLRTPENATAEERLDVMERRVEEQAQAKVEASQRFPLKISGMLVANLYKNSPAAAGVDHPTTAARVPGRSTAGLTFRQSVIGLEYHGAQTLWGGHVKGSVFTDFFEGNIENTLYAPMRLRTATVEIDWGSRSLMVGQEKPLFSQRDPTSFSFIGVSPLTSAGNLWRWQPQIRFEQRLALGPQTQLRAQAALLQTNEDSSTGDVRIAQERRRPGLEGRFEVAHKFDENRRIAIAPGFHVSTTHALGRQLPSRVWSLDWFANPWAMLELSGLFWSGENVHHFGALRQGLTLFPDGRLTTVKSKGGWAQAAVPFTNRVSLNLFGGIHDDRNRDLLPTAIGANHTGGVNLMMRIAPNLLLSVEALQTRTRFLTPGPRKNNRYDLSVVYLF